MDKINSENDLSSPLFMSENHKEIGNGYFKSGKLDQALEEYSEGLTYDPSSVILLSNRAMVLFKQKQYEASIEDAKKCIENDPSWVKAYVRMG